MLKFVFSLYLIIFSSKQLNADNQSDFLPSASGLLIGTIIQQRIDTANCKVLFFFVAKMTNISDDTLFFLDLDTYRFTDKWQKYCAQSDSAQFLRMYNYLTYGVDRPGFRSFHNLKIDCDLYYKNSRNLYKNIPITGWQGINFYFDKYILPGGSDTIGFMASYHKYDSLYFKNGEFYLPYYSKGLFHKQQIKF